MDKLFSYAKYAAYALIALLVLRLAMYNSHASSASTILYAAAIVSTILLLGFFIGLIANSKKGSPVIIPATIGAFGEGLTVVSTVMFMIFFMKMNPDAPSDAPVKLLNVANIIDSVALFIICVAFIYLSIYFGKNSAPRFAAWAVAAVLLIFFAIGKIVQPWEWSDIEAVTRFNMIRYFANNILLYGTYAWFLLSFANLKRK